MLKKVLIGLVVIGIIVGAIAFKKYQDFFAPNVPSNLDQTLVQIPTGATFEEVPTAGKRDLGIEGGVQVTDLSSGKWRSVGMKKGFVITHVNKEEVASLEEFITMINNEKDDGLLIKGYYPDGEKAFYGIGW